MKTKLIIAGILLAGIAGVSAVVVLPEAARTRPAAGSVEAWAEYMDELVPELMDAQDVPGLIIAVIKDGKTVYLDAFGYADQENRILMTKETRCRVESISKSVTARGVMKLAEEGEIDLDKPLETYLKTWSIPDSPYSEDMVTIRQLLSQTSGMPLGTIGIRYNPEGELPPLKEFLAGEAIMFQEPGKSFSYSNAGYNLLELLIEEVTGRKFAEYMSEEVLNLLRMKDSSFNWSSEWEPEVPNGYDDRGRPIPVYVYPDKASGGLFSTAADIAAFVAAGMRDNEINRALLKTETVLSGYYSLIFDGYGLGHFIELLPGGVKAVSNGGQGSGWMTQFYSVPETGDGIVMLSNSQRSWPLFSDILAHWSRWSGLPPVGMELIRQAALVLRILLAISSGILPIAVIRTVLSLRRHKRRFFLVNRTIGPRQIIQFSFALALTAVVIIISRMKYFFLSSVFPVETPLLGGLIIFGAAILLLLSLVPVQDESMIISAR